MISRKNSLIFLIIGFLAFSSFEIHAAKALMSLKPGDPAPDFQIRTIGGKEITLGSLKGKIAILAFWKRGQDYSEKALSDLERIHQEYQDKGVIVLAVNADEALESEIRSIRAALNLNYLLASDKGLGVYGRFGVMVLPTTLLIGPEGKLVYYRPIHMRDFYLHVQGQVRILLGEITPARLEAELNPHRLPEMSEAREKANRYLNLGRALMDIGLKEKARIELEKAVEADPSLPEPHILLARFYLEKKEIIKAKAKLEQALKLDPGSKDAKVLLDRLRQMEDE